MKYQFFLLCFSAEKYMPDSYIRVDAIESDLPLVLKSAFCLARESSAASVASNDASSGTLLVSDQFEYYHHLIETSVQNSCLV
jgi:hypothetical protein